MKYFSLQKNTSKNRGFVILFAVLVSSIILLISANIFNVIKKEIILSSYTQESQRAFSVADSALECALYMDIIGENNPGITEFSAALPQGFNCGGDTIDVNYLDIQTDEYQFSWSFRYYNSNNNSNDNSCAYVLIEKNEKGTDISIFETRITSIGYNVCTNRSGTFTGKINIPDFDDPSILERRLSLSYSS